jgi:hypothetical protein
MRFLFSLLFLSIILNSPAREIKLVRATSQRWYAGMAGGGNGITYKITLEAKDSTIIPDTIWIGSSIYVSPTFIKTYNKDTKVSTYYFNNETNYESVRKPGVYDQDTTKITKQIKLCEGEAMIRYQDKKTGYLFIIGSFESLPALYYP